ncbi:zinc finger protein, partial [Loa loa]
MAYMIWFNLLLCIASAYNAILSSLSVNTNNTVVHYPASQNASPTYFSSFTIPFDNFPGQSATVQVVQPNQSSNDNAMEYDDIPDDFHWVLFGNKNKKSKIQP